MTKVKKGKNATSLAKSNPATKTRSLFRSPGGQKLKQGRPQGKGNTRPTHIKGPKSVRHSKHGQKFGQKRVFSARRREEELNREKELHKFMKRKYHFIQKSIKAAASETPVEKITDVAELVNPDTVSLCTCCQLLFYGYGTFFFVCKYSCVLTWYKASC